MSQRKRPAGNRPSPKSTAADIFNDSPDRRHSTPSADELREARLLEELAALGYTVAVSCRECGHPLVSPKSIARGHIGPKCAARVVSAYV